MKTIYLITPSDYGNPLKCVVRADTYHFLTQDSNCQTGQPITVIHYGSSSIRVCGDINEIELKLRLAK